MTPTADLLTAARTGDPTAYDELVGPLRPGLLLHCYRMLASAHDAEDAVQETLLRAWRGLGGFDGRSALRTWLVTIATNVCLREVERRGRRVVPMDLSGRHDPTDGVAAPLSETVWLGPLPGAGLAWESSPVDAVYEQKEAVELAFVAALQHLPPLQRATLVMRDVLAFSAVEVAEALEVTVPSVTSALARARASMGAKAPRRSQQRLLDELGADAVRQVVTRFVSAWERNDVDAVVALLAEDVVMAMPPFGEWYAGRAAVADFLRTRPLAGGSTWRLLPTSANAQPAVTHHVWDERTGAWLAHSLTVLTLGTDGLVGLDAFLDPAFATGVRPGRE